MSLENKLQDLITEADLTGDLPPEIIQERKSMWEELYAKYSNIQDDDTSLAMEEFENYAAFPEKVSTKDHLIRSATYHEYLGVKAENALEVATALGNIDYSDEEDIGEEEESDDDYDDDDKENDDNRHDDFQAKEILTPNSKSFEQTEISFCSPSTSKPPDHQLTKRKAGLLDKIDESLNRLDASLSSPKKYVLTSVKKQSDVGKKQIVSDDVHDDKDEQNYDDDEYFFYTHSPSKKVDRKVISTNSHKTKQIESEPSKKCSKLPLRDVSNLAECPELKEARGDSGDYRICENCNNPSSYPLHLKLEEVSVKNYGFLCDNCMCKLRTKDCKCGDCKEILVTMTWRWIQLDAYKKTNNVT